MTIPPPDAELREAVAAREPLIRDTIAFVHAHPELPHEEHACSGYLRETLRGLGLDVEAGLAGMVSGFRATLPGATPGRTVGIVALYDAVASVPPEGGIEPVHSCGHGPIAGSVIGAVAALADRRELLAGRGRRVPSALIGVGRRGGWAFHTPIGAEEFASEDGVAAATTMAKVLALAAVRLTARD